MPSLEKPSSLEMTNHTRYLEAVKKHLDATSPSFCLAKWSQTTIYLNSGHTHSCHHPGVHPIPVEGLVENPSQIHNTPFKIEKRMEMIDGKRPSECDYCWRIEDLNTDELSDRIYKSSEPWSLRQLGDIKKNPSDPNHKPAYVEVMFDSTCNFACTYCMPDVSSKWYDEIKRYGHYQLKDYAHQVINQRAESPKVVKDEDDNPYIDAFWRVLPEWWPTLDTFRITGGEPLLSKHTWAMMDYIAEKGNRNLRFAVNTNLGVPKQKIDELISRSQALVASLKSFTIFTSFEATGKECEFIRHGIVYDEFINNVERVLDETKANVTIMTTVNALCYKTFGSFIDELIRLRQKPGVGGERFFLSFNFLRGPSFLDCQFLPITVKEQFNAQIQRGVEKLKEISAHGAEISHLQRLGQYLMQTPDPYLVELNQERLSDYLIEQGKRRGYDVMELFPELIRK